MKKMKLNFDMNLSDFVDLNKSFTKAKCCIAYVGKNRNRSNISKESFINALPSLNNVPIVGRYDREKDQFGEHDIELIKDENGGYEIINATIPYGVVPESANKWFDFCTIDGVERECVFTDVILWKRQYGYERIKEVGALSQSMEIDIEDYSILDDGFVDIKKFSFEALCMLESAEPCFENAQVSLYTKGDPIESFKLQFSEMLKEMKELGGSILKDKEIKDSFSEEMTDALDENFKEDSVVEEDLENKEEKFEEDSQDVVEYSENKEEVSEEEFTADECIAIEQSELSEEEFTADSESVVVELSEEDAEENKFSTKYATYREKLESLSNLIANSPIVENNEVVGYCYRDLMDFDDKYIFVKETSDNWLAGSYDIGYFKQEYAVDEKEVNYLLIGEKVKIVKVFLTEDELAMIESNASESVLKEFNEYKEQYSSEEFEQLVEFKKGVELEKREADEKRIFDNYSDALGKYDEFSTLWENRKDYSIGDLEKECIYLVGKFALKDNLLNKNFAEENENKKETKLHFSVDHSANESSEEEFTYGGYLKKFD